MGPGTNTHPTIYYKLRWWVVAVGSRCRWVVPVGVAGRGAGGSHAGGSVVVGLLAGGGASGRRAARESRCWLRVGLRVVAAVGVGAADGNGGGGWRREERRSSKKFKYAAQSVRALPIRILSVGKKRSQGLQLMVDEYVEKLKLYCTVEDVLIRSNPRNARDQRAQVDDEDMAVMNLIRSDDWVVMLDERGQDIGSEKMAELVGDAGNTGASRLSFCIGGPYGHGRKMRERANISIKLSSLVLNHQIALLVLMEQLYRSWTILRGQKLGQHFGIMNSVPTILSTYLSLVVLNLKHMKPVSHIRNERLDLHTLQSSHDLHQQLCNLTLKVDPMASRIGLKFHFGTVGVRLCYLSKWLGDRSSTLANYRSEAVKRFSKSDRRRGEIERDRVMADEKVVEGSEKKETSTAATNENGGEKKKKEEEGKKGIISRIWNVIFRSNRDDFEKRLQYISKEEATVMTRMSRRSHSWRRKSRQIIIFSVIFEVIAVVYAIMTTRSTEMNWKMRAIRVLPMFLLPVLSSAAYSTFVSYIRFCDRKDQKILEKLRAERQAKIDELKEKTNYYTTQQLIQRYDTDPAAKAAAATVLASKLGADSGLKVYVGDESNPGAPTGKSNDAELGKSTGLRNRKQVQSQSRSTTPGTATPNHSDQQQLVGSGGIAQTQTSEHNQLVVVEHHQPQSSTANDGGWIARIAALLVGEDPAQSFALICGNCHMHNGLSRKEDYPFITYYCPHCHALNKPKQLDELITGSNSPNTEVAEVVKNASASAIDSIIKSNNPISTSPEIEEVSERASLGEKSS
ncbi:hypothetical protein RIF29_27122 [Crotalaria pallida]|uniref:Lunapark zinc ribbon domain-containing protein n=1 Tax=Crotalaria pallida TaxID=3830 RepID=A0AAN9EPG9_CROPI